MVRNSWIPGIFEDRDERIMDKFNVKPVGGSKLFQVGSIGAQWKQRDTKVG